MNHTRSTPDELINGLAERAIQIAIYNLIARHELDFQAFLNKNNSNRRIKAEQKLINASKEQIEYILSTINYSRILEIDIEKLEISIVNQVSNLKFSEWEADPEYRYSEITSINFVRKIGTQSLYKIEIPYNYREKLVKNWRSNLSGVNLPYQIIDVCKLWRAGSFLFFICDGDNVTLEKILKIISKYWEDS